MKYKYLTRTRLMSTDLEKLIDTLADSGWEPILMTQSGILYTVVFRAKIQLH